MQSVSATDGFVLDDGRIIAIHPKPEPIMKITSLILLVLLGILGIGIHLPNTNRSLLIQQDHVLEDMLLFLGANIEKLEAAFTPEGGAYGHGERYSHDHNSLETSLTQSNHHH